MTSLEKVKQKMDSAIEDLKLRNVEDSDILSPGFISEVVAVLEIWEDELYSEIGDAVSTIDDLEDEKSDLEIEKSRLESEFEELRSDYQELVNRI